MNRRLLFVINPNSGKKNHEPTVSLIRGNMPAGLPYEIAVWAEKNNFAEIVSRINKEGFTDVIAVGGDGTVNQVAKSLTEKNIALGIMPAGSGNGLARSLGLSMKPEKALAQIIEGKKTRIDYGTVNGTPFFCTSGVGFDAHIGNLFATSKKRGLKSYVKITVRELFKYRAKTYTIKFDGKVMSKKAFLITVANAGQYGNDFYIAPEADLQDGLFHIVILKPFNALKVAGLMRRILSRQAFLAKSIETYAADKLVIERAGHDTIHYDGEPAEEGDTLAYEIKKGGMEVIVGEKFKAR